jgi:hypothetical protein
MSEVGWHVCVGQKSGDAQVLTSDGGQELVVAGEQGENGSEVAACCSAAYNESVLRFCIEGGGAGDCPEKGVVVVVDAGRELVLWRETGAYQSWSAFVWIGGAYTGTLQ